ncbi:YgaP family membrane protein [Alicyclobacillus acidiphilus]|uniref:YgaP family membrane protein n=1 Tax=Alicyclobacillus acidiphilus TaxID=182455 RepID=UPI0008328755|nr:DUF2892 domain-containing protein [Alicyclobacillus acidiphilus]
MGVEANLSMPDRYFRLATGVLSIASATRGRRQSVLTRAFLLSYGAMKVAEGVTGWCPMRYATTLIAGDKKSGESGKQAAKNESPTGQKENQGKHSHSSGKETSGKDSSARSEESRDRKHEGDASIPNETISYLMDSDDAYRATSH